MAWTASLNKGQSFDEALQLAVGYNIWLHDDYRLEGANGDLVKRWATLPYLVSRPHFISRADPLWQHADSYEFGRRFFFAVGNQPEALLWQGRLMVALLGVAAGLVVFGCSRELFGPAGGLVSLALFVSSAHMLAFGGIVSTDMPIILTLIGSTCCIWRLLHEVTPARAAASLAFFALLVLAKMSALAIFPITAGLVVVRFIGGRAWRVRWRAATWDATSRKSHAAMVAGLVLLHALAGWTAIWAHYGFRYEASPDPAWPAMAPKVTFRDGAPRPLVEVLAWSRRHRALPEGFIRGVERLLGEDDRLPAFMAGRTKLGGFREFFPYAIWVKTQPTLLLLLVAGSWNWWRLRRAANARGGAAPSFYAAAPHFVLPAVYLAIAVAEDINLGHRHVLPIYPSLYVLAGAVALGWRRHAHVD